MRLLNFCKLSILLVIVIYILFRLRNGIFSHSITSNKSSVSYDTNALHTNFYFIIKHLLKLRVDLLLIDPYFLDCLFIRELSFQNLEIRFITFGITADSIQALDSLILEDKFSIFISKSVNNTSVDHIFIEYEQQIVHLAILHEEKSYFLIRKSTVTLPIGVKLSYGDTVRVIELAELQFINDRFLFSYPQDVSHFLWLYNISEFVDCDHNLANEMKNKYGLYQNKSQMNLVTLPMRTINTILNKLEKHYWLAGGTLLGWYRHCGLIPYTQDVDFGLFAEEYDESIRDAFLGNPIVYLWGALGLVNDSLEFRLFTGRYTFDLFWAYRENDHRWCGYQANRAKYRQDLFKRLLPLLPKLCSCDLFGHRFSIPCSPVDYLNKEYGYERWKSPLEKNYTWINMKYASTWDDISWMYAIRLYTAAGELRQDAYALNWITQHFNYSLKSIPSFLNVLPNRPVTLPPVKT